MSRSSLIHEDPLIHSEATKAKQAGLITAIACAAIVAHGMAMATISLASRFAKSDGAEPKVERVAMEIVDTEVPPPVEPPPTPEPVPDTEAETPAIVEPEVTPEPERKVKKRKPRVAVVEPPSDPIDEPPPEPAKPIRRTIGLSLESTVSGGDGPAFNIGNSRMGQTSRVGNDASRVDQRKGASGPAAKVRPPTPGPNRVAAHIPGSKTKLVRPKRISRVKPSYPSVLRAQNIEGTVVLRVRINAQGKVTKVDIVAGAKHSAFNESARVAALQERFRPATKNGVAIPYDITFSSRFRIEGA